MKKYTPGGCGCCDCPSLAFYSADRWSPGSGGTAADAAGENEVDLDGEVNPSAFLASEAWSLSFVISTGAVTFTIDSVNYTVDAGTQTLTVNGTSVEFGRAATADKTSTVELRVTPSHAYLLVYGNYGGTFGMRTVGRSGAAPASFSSTWSSATVSDFRILDSTVLVEEDGTEYYSPTYETVCWVAPDVLSCPYIVAKQASKNHQYFNATNTVEESIFGVTRTLSGDVDLSDVSLSGGNALFDDDSVTWIDDAFWSWRIQGASPGGTLMTTPSSDFDFRFGDGPCAELAEATRWREEPSFFDWDYGSYHDSRAFCFKRIRLHWEDPTVSEPYPMPIFVAELRMTYSVVYQCTTSTFPPTNSARGVWTSFGEAVAEIAVNSLPSGFSLTVVPEGTFEWEDEIEPDPSDNCPDQDANYTIGGTWDVSFA